MKWDAVRGEDEEESGPRGLPPFPPGVGILNAWSAWSPFGTPYSGGESLDDAGSWGELGDSGGAVATLGGGEFVALYNSPSSRASFSSWACCLLRAT